VDWGGFELSHDWREFGLVSKWRYRCYSFSVAFLPFFFFKECIACIKGSVAGDEKFEQKTRNQRLRVRIFARAEMADPSTREVSTMRMQTFVEKWTQRRTFWNVTTLFLQRMWIALYKVVKTFLPFSFKPKPPRGII
jgi:hypothetical protein